MSTLGIDVNTPVGADGMVDLDPLFGLVSGRTALVQAIARRWTTVRGTLAWINDDPDYGEPVQEFIGSESDGRTNFVVASRLEREALRDERVKAARVTTSITAGRLTILAQITDADGPFRLTLAVSSVGVELLKVY